MTWILTCKYIFVVVQLLNYVWLFAIPWTAAHQASLSFAIFRSLLRFTSIELVMLSNHLILCCSLSFCLQFSPLFPISRLYHSTSVKKMWIIFSHTVLNVYPFQNIVYLGTLIKLSSYSWNGHYPQGHIPMNLHLTLHGSVSSLLCYPHLIGV